MRNDDLTNAGERKSEYTMADVRRHQSRGDCWMVLNGVVYDVTKYVDFHPGGAEELLRGAGEDATSMFVEAHPWVNYESMLESCVVGKLAASEGAAGGAKGARKGGSKLARGAVAMDGEAGGPSRAGGPVSSGQLLRGDGAWESVQLVSRGPASQDGSSVLFRFAMPEGCASLGLQHAGQHLDVRFIDGGMAGRTGRAGAAGEAGRTTEVIRPYTPVPPMQLGAGAKETKDTAEAGEGGAAAGSPAPSSSTSSTSTSSSAAPAAASTSAG